MASLEILSFLPNLLTIQLLPPVGIRVVNSISVGFSSTGAGWSIVEFEEQENTI